MSAPNDPQGSAPHASRLPPAMVPPVTIDGVTYRQLSGSLDPDIGQVGGLLGAFDASGERLWWIKVYDNVRNPDLEGDVQDVFFRSMEQRPDGTLLIVNERGERFSVDVAKRTSTKVVAPVSDKPGGLLRSNRP